MIFSLCFILIYIELLMYCWILGPVIFSLAQIQKEIDRPPVFGPDITERGWIFTPRMQWYLLVSAGVFILWTHSPNIWNVSVQ